MRHFDMKRYPRERGKKFIHYFGGIHVVYVHQVRSRLNNICCTIHYTPFSTFNKLCCRVNSSMIYGDTPCIENEQEHFLCVTHTKVKLTLAHTYFSVKPLYLILVGRSICKFGIKNCRKYDKTKAIFEINGKLEQIRGEATD